MANTERRNTKRKNRRFQRSAPNCNYIWNNRLWTAKTTCYKHSFTQMLCPHAQNVNGKAIFAKTWFWTLAIWYCQSNSISLEWERMAGVSNEIETIEISYYYTLHVIFMHQTIEFSLTTNWITSIFYLCEHFFGIVPIELTNRLKICSVTSTFPLSFALH